MFDLELDDLIIKILLEIGNNRLKVTSILNKKFASKQTVANRIEKLVNSGLLESEKEISFPPRRYLFLSRKGKYALHDYMRTLEERISTIKDIEAKYTNKA